jgi:hypothetical protein
MRQAETGTFSEHSVLNLGVVSSRCFACLDFPAGSPAFSLNCRAAWDDFAGGAACSGGRLLWT